MDILQEREEKKSKLEKQILFVYTLYMIAILGRAISQGWSKQTVFLLIFCLVVPWGVCMRSVKDYAFRAKLVTVLAECSLLLYSYETKDLYSSMPLQVAFMILLGIYEVRDVVKITFLFSLANFFFHGVVMETIPLQTDQDFWRIAGQIGNIIIVEGVVAWWIRMRINDDTRVIKLIEELRISERSKDDFLANVSHEIRTPINTICGISEIVLRDDLSLGIRENVLSIQNAGQNLMSIVSDILDFSELQSGKMELEEETYYLSATLSEVVTMANARKMDKKIELIIDCDANIPNTLIGDEKKLRRIIMNLVDNAIKFTEKGCVTIALEYRREAYGINLIITVRDTGIGMETEFLEKIFTHLYQADTSTRRTETGLGLGLAITHALVRKMGGIITIKSRAERGTEVKVVLPQKVVDATAMATIRKPSEVHVGIFIDLEQFGIMTIRDEYNNMIMHMVSDLKVKTHVCRNIKQLKRLDEKECFSHVFMNLTEYRANKAYFDELSGRCKVMVITDSIDDKFITNGKVLKIYKPFSVLDVVQAINGSTGEEQEYMKSAMDKFETRDTRVLVVDDNRMNIRVIVGLLEQYKMEVAVAYSGREALEKIETEDFDFVFMDYMMPEMDGVETMQRIRQKVGEYYRKIPIIALTANAVIGTREMLLAAGFNDFMEKPIEKSVLERVILRNLPGEKIVFEENVKEQSVKEEPKVKEVPVYVAREEILSEKEKEEPKKPENIALQTLETMGLDTQKGMVYCGGEEGYIKIIEGYCADYEESIGILNICFDKQDWKNYTINVHGIKSAMASIGAMQLSEWAKKLEAAGKTDDINYILENHEELAEGYVQFFSELNKLGVGKGSEEENAMLELPEITTQEFDEILEQMETAMFELDQDVLKRRLRYLAEFQYKGKALTGIAEKALKNVEKSDFMEAVDMIAEQRKILG